MSAKLVAIGKSAPDAAVVAILSDLLERAKAGTLRSIVYAGESDDGTYTTGYETDDAIVSIGLMASAMHNLMASQREKSE